MTDAEWWATSSDPELMLGLVGDLTGKRKLHLFLCACCRSVWSWLDQATQASVEHAEKLAGTPLSVRVKIDLADGSTWRADKRLGEFTTSDEGHGTNLREATSIASRIDSIYNLTAAQSGQAVQSDIVRDIFGNPFRSVAFDARWRTSNAVRVARTIYDDLAFDRMPMLAVALMDAGCEDEQVISHCRSDGSHVRGCWVVDLVLGKQ